MSDIQTHIKAAMVRNLVQKTIVCPVTEEVLDARTCVVILDRDDDPRLVVSQAGWKIREPVMLQLDGFVHGGWHVDPSTVKAAVSTAPDAVQQLNGTTYAGQPVIEAERILAVRTSPLPAGTTTGRQPTPYKVKLEDKIWRRVYVLNYGNGGGTPYIFVSHTVHYLTPEAQAKVEGRE